MRKLKCHDSRFVCLCFRANDRLNIGAVWFGSRGLKLHTEAHIYNSMLLSKNILAAHLKCSKVIFKIFAVKSLVLRVCYVTTNWLTVAPLEESQWCHFSYLIREDIKYVSGDNFFFGKSTSLILIWRQFKKSRRYLFKNSLHYLFIWNSLVDPPVDNCAVIERIKEQTYVVYWIDDMVAK